MTAGPEILLWFVLTCIDIPVEPELVAAVSRVECNGFVLGPIDRKGRYIGPMGLEKSFRKKWDIDNPVVNTRVGAWTLYKKLKKTGGNKIAALKKYNTEYNSAYGKEVMKWYKIYKGRKESQG